MDDAAATLSQAERLPLIGLMAAAAASRTDIDLKLRQANEAGYDVLAWSAVADAAYALYATTRRLEQRLSRLAFEREARRAVETVLKKGNG